MVDLAIEFDKFMDKIFCSLGHGIMYTEDSLPVHTVYVSKLHHKTNEGDLRVHFSNFGLIDNIVLCRKKATYAFITFHNAEDATKALREKETTICKRRVRVDIADSWHQPKSIQKEIESEETKEKQSDSNEVADDGHISILKLNHDCWLHILSYLDLFDLHNLDQASPYFKDLTQIQYKKYRTLDIADLTKQQPEDKRHRITLMVIRNILRQIGNFVTTLKFPGIEFLKPSLRVVELIPRYCKNVKHLCIDGFTIRHGTLHKFRPIFAKLETLDLIHCLLTEKVEIFFGLAKNLKKINLTSNHELTGKCLNTLRNLESLNLYNCINIQPKYFSQFLINNKTLQYLNIGRCQRLNEKNFEDMAINLTELNHLVISNHYVNINNNAMVQLGRLPKLKKIQIIKGGYSNLDALFMELANENKLEHLDIFDGIVTDNGLTYLRKFTHLKYFKFVYKSDLSDSLLNTLVFKKELEFVYLTGCCSISNNGLLEFIKNCPNLKCLDVSGCTQISEQFLMEANEYLSKNKLNHNTKIEIICGLTEINEEIILDHIKVTLQCTFDFQFSAEMLDFDGVFSDEEEDDDHDGWRDVDYDCDSDHYYNMCEDSSDYEDSIYSNFFY